MQAWMLKKWFKMSLAVIVNAVFNVGLIALLISVIFVFLISKLHPFKKGDKLRILIFVNYVIYVLWLMIFSRNFNMYPRRISIELYFFRFNWYSILQILHNIMLTIPFGYFVRSFTNMGKSYIYCYFRW